MAIAILQWPSLWLYVKLKKLFFIISTPRLWLAQGRQWLWFADF
jgi:hypothetical protein